MTRQQFITNLKGANEIANEEAKILKQLDAEMAQGNTNSAEDHDGEFDRRNSLNPDLIDEISNNASNTALIGDTLEVGEIKENEPPSGMQGLEDLDEQMLSEIYDRIEKKELKTGQDASSQVKQIEDSLVNKQKLQIELDNQPLAVPWRRLLCYCRLQQVMEPSKAQATNKHMREVFLFADLLQGVF